MARLKAKKTEGPADTLGAQLKRAREEKDISLEEAHRSTKIHPTMLQALEEDRLENILGRTYVKAFLRNYAHYLGLDVNSVIKEYLSKCSAEHSQNIDFAKKPIFEKKKRNYSHVIIIALAIIIWLSILGFAAMKFIHHYRNITQNKKNMTLRETEIPKTEVEEIGKELLPIPKNRTITLTLVASNDVWLKVTRDGEVSFHGILSKNSKETWRADNEIKLSEIGRPEVLKLNVNGEDIGLSGKRLGKNIFITHKGIDLEPKP